MSVRRDQMASLVVCRGCGWVVPDSEPYPFACPAAGDAGDHVLHRVLDFDTVSFPDAAGTEAQPFVRYRGLLHARHLAVAGGLGDDAFVRIVRDLDGEVARIEGRGIIETPFALQLALGEAVGLGGPLFVKDETGNVAGSHKARHLFGVLVHLEVVEQIGLASRGDRPLAIASCGNAALAAAVVAAAGCRELHVFVPTDADAAVVDRLSDLGARVTVCPREPGVTGDPSYMALEAAIAGGAIPFTCQGNQNGMAIEGGETLGYEMIASLARLDETLDHVVVQVGGGALASAVAAAFSEARALGVIDRIPRFHTVQTEGAWPLKRAFDRVSALAEEHPGPDRFHWALHEAARRRADFMWPWETTPHSIAHGILDDETYDWLAVVEAMLLTRGRPVVVSDDELEKANALALETTGIQVDPTGSAGLAGLIHLRREGVIGPGESAAVLFTGAIR
ncbi:MAG: pyridoxal-phosphate dependent enzyme [Acidimicrobiales bacterium]